MAINNKRYQDFIGSDTVDNDEEIRTAKLVASPVFSSGATTHQFFSAL